MQGCLSKAQRLVIWHPLQEQMLALIQGRAKRATKASRCNTLSYVQEPGERAWD